MLLWKLFFDINGPQRINPVFMINIWPFNKSHHQASVSFCVLVRADFQKEDVVQQLLWEVEPVTVQPLNPCQDPFSSGVINRVTSWSLGNTWDLSDIYCIYYTEDDKGLIWQRHSLGLVCVFIVSVLHLSYFLCLISAHTCSIHQKNAVNRQKSFTSDWSFDKIQVLHTFHIVIFFPQLT